MPAFSSFMPNPRLAPPSIFFEDTVISGITPMIVGQPFDEIINRPQGMKGYILNLTIEGEGQIRDGNEVFTVQKGDLLLFPPHVPHYYHIKPGAERWFHQWIYFFARPSWQEALDWDGRPDRVSKYSLPDEVFEEFSATFLEIIKRNKQVSSCAQVLSMNYLEELLFRRLELASERQQPIADSRVSLALMFMRENLERADLDLQQIADVVHLSKSRLLHIFAVTLGVSPIQWLIEERMKLAQRLLLTTQLKVEEVAFKVGISDPTYFFRCFKKRFKLTPQQFRQSLSSHKHMQHRKAPVL